jgi:hypothetical protein
VRGEKKRERGRDWRGKVKTEGASKKNMLDIMTQNKKR